MGWDASCQSADKASVLSYKWQWSRLEISVSTRESLVQWSVVTASLTTWRSAMNIKISTRGTWLVDESASWSMMRRRRMGSRALKTRESIEQVATTARSVLYARASSSLPGNRNGLNFLNLA